jgi:hypothetical protein
MKAYHIRPFDRRPGTTIRMGLPPITIAIGDEVNPVEYVKEQHPELLRDPLCVDLYDESEKLIWESYPPHA